MEEMEMETIWERHSRESKEWNHYVVYPILIVGLLSLIVTIIVSVSNYTRTPSVLKKGITVLVSSEEEINIPKGMCIQGSDITKVYNYYNGLPENTIDIDDIKNPYITKSDMTIVVKEGIAVVCSPDQLLFYQDQIDQILSEVD